MNCLRLGWILLCVLGFGLAAPAAAGPLENGAAAHDMGDYENAMRLWRPLAEAGDPHAQHNIAVMYANGQGVKQDYAEAMRWYRKAADQGLGESRSNIGLLYAGGAGTAPDYVEAYKWIMLAMAADLRRGSHREIVLKDRDWVVTQMTPADIAKAERLVREWKPGAAK